MHNSLSARLYWVAPRQKFWLHFSQVAAPNRKANRLVWHCTNALGTPHAARREWVVTKMKTKCWLRCLPCISCSKILLFFLFSFFSLFLRSRMCVCGYVCALNAARTQWTMALLVSVRTTMLLDHSPLLARCDSTFHFILMHLFAHRPLLRMLAAKWIIT